MVNIERLCKTYGESRVVDGVDLSVQRGECLGLLGPNGAGKTTTLRMLLGLTAPDAGVVQVLELPIPAQARAMRARIGVVPQMDNLDPDFSVIENLRGYASYFGISPRSIESRIEELLAFAALTNKRHARTETLSGGMKRRLSLARALVNDPELVVLDEPTTGLDPQARQLIWQRLRRLVGEGTTLILTTHYMEEAERLCNRVAIMDHGRILALAPPRELIAQCVEQNVIEVYGPGLDAWLTASESTDEARIERLGETAFCYVANERPIIEELCARHDIEFRHRRANLEDVFLKLTGRDLRD
ncbi:MAG: hypothetical protein AMJ69_11475 [Gammaproteobacteria bacterium SG8_47]|nr:MAG: hypothetical protein AMJ69_11475 [Gammaproteobacteria bacterium SG8_47]